MGWSQLEEPLGDAGDAGADLLRAKFACDMCLASPATILVSGTPQRRTAIAECSSCGHRSCTLLTLEHATLLWRLNRQVTYIHFAGDAI